MPDPRDHQLSSYDYPLPPERIAQAPVEPRHSARLLMVPPQGEPLTRAGHGQVWDLLDQLQPEEYSTGTFTLSNLGMFGVDRFDAILPPGTGAILAVAASRPTVVAGKDGSISVKRQMQVNLTADHRVIYGADGAAFLKDLAELIENRPESLAL